MPNLQEQVQDWVHSYAQDADARAAALAAAQAQWVRTAWWETHRLPPTLDGKPFTPRQRAAGPVPEEPPPLGPSHNWAHDGSELWDIDARGRRLPHGAGYRCPNCYDSGWLRPDVPAGHPDLGTVRRCSCTVEDAATRQERIAARLRRSGLPQGLWTCTFATFQQRPGTEAAVNTLQDVFEALRVGAETPRWVALFGGVGVGKTHLGAAFVQSAALLADVVWARVPDFLADCKANQFERDEVLTHRAQDVDVLVLDEVGSQADREWGTEKLERILDRRYAERRVTVLAMTMAPRELQAWSPRIADRVADRRLCMVSVLTCPSYRREGAA